MQATYATREISPVFRGNRAGDDGRDQESGEDDELREEHDE